MFLERIVTMIVRETRLTYPVKCQILKLFKIISFYESNKKYKKINDFMQIGTGITMTRKTRVN